MDGSLGNRRGGHDGGPVTDKAGQRRAENAKQP